MRAQAPAIAVILTAVYATAMAQLPKPAPLAKGTSAIRGEGRYFVTAMGRAEQQVWVAHEPVDFFGTSIDISASTSCQTPPPTSPSSFVGVREYL